MKYKIFERLCKKELLYEAWVTVKAKNSSGGIDGMSIKDFDVDSDKYLTEILAELKSGKWAPFPYMGISIPKKQNEKREIGLLSIKDKVVQTAIKILVEPRFERLFLNNSYGYRPGKGHNKAVKRTMQECQNKKRNWVVRLDIDNYFDSIDHDILTPRLHSIISDEEIVRLIMLCIKMGRVNKNMKWQEIKTGVPQGAVISPVISNFYLHPFDQFVQTLPCEYVRYADDFVMVCNTMEEADTVLERAGKFLSERLKLNLNTPQIFNVNDGFDFLGVNISRKSFGLSEAKRKDIREKIGRFDFDAEGFSQFSIKTWKGFRNYYCGLLSQDILIDLDILLIGRIKELIPGKLKAVPSRSILNRILSEIEFLSETHRNNKKNVFKELLHIYDAKKAEAKSATTNDQNKKIVERRKKEYQKRERENKELVVSTFGSIIGISQKCVTVKQQGKIVYQKPIGILSHITVQGKGISLSSNLIEYCLSNKISIDFFNSNGSHTGSVLSTKYIENTLWCKQAGCGTHKRNHLALKIIKAKLRNQLNLVKYFHKYHKNTNSKLLKLYEALNNLLNLFTAFEKNNRIDDDEFLVKLVSYEAQGATKYWAYIKELLSDDKQQFERREHKGAKDLVNCMLNYGYAILYSRVWQALLKAKLNPFDSIIHVRQSGKPTFVYDVVEIFRAQVVDRVVITLVQKGLPLKLTDGLLEDDTKRNLSKGILDRINRYEYYRGEELTMEEIIGRQAKEIARFISEENIHYKPYISKW